MAYADDMEGTSSETELRRLLAELRRRPHLLRDPHIARLVSAAVARLQATSSPAADTQESPAKPAASRELGSSGVLQCLGDLLAIGALLYASSYLPERLVFVTPFGAGLLLVFVWLFMRAEALRVMAIEVVELARRAVWSGCLWYAEAFFAPARTAWHRERRVDQLLAAWQLRPPTERRSFASLMAFVEAELGLSLTELGALGEPPDWSRIEGRLGKFANPVLRWRGDKRLLPSSLRWIIARAVILATAAEEAKARGREAAEATDATHNRPDHALRAEHVATMLSAEEADRIRARMKTLEEEIRKIQQWNIKKEEEEISRRSLINEKRDELNNLRRRLNLFN